jgi:hypothetical protein
LREWGLLSEGKGILKPTGIKIVYPWVDLENKQVEARIEYEGKLIMKVIIDVQTGNAVKEGNIDEIAHLTSNMNEEAYLKMFKDWATIFIENGISSPKDYFEQFKK